MGYPGYPLPYFLFSGKEVNDARKGAHAYWVNIQDEPVSEDVTSGSTADGPSCEGARLDG